MGRKSHGFLGLVRCDAVNLKHNPAALDNCDKMIHSALAAAHGSFVAFQGDGLVRKNADPDLAAAGYVAGHSAPSRFNLPARDPAVGCSAQTKAAKGQVVSGGGFAMGMAPVLLAVFSFFRNQHNILNFELFAFRFKHFTFVNPDFDAHCAISRKRRGTGKINVGAQSMQWQFAFVKPFSAGDFRAAESAGHRDFDAQSASVHDLFQGGFDDAAVRHALFNLLDEGASPNLGFDVHLLGLFDRDFDEGSDL